MARVPLSELPVKLRAVEARSRQFREEDDCSVIALALGADISYDQAHRLMALTGRERHGAPAAWWRFTAAWELLGVQLRIVPPRLYDGCVTVRQLLERPFIQQDRYLVVLNRKRDWTAHVFVVEEGEMLDYPEVLRRRNIHTVWKIIRWEDQFK